MFKKIINVPLLALTVVNLALVIRYGATVLSVIALILSAATFAVSIMEAHCGK
jgi:hypothetical protein